MVPGGLRIDGEEDGLDDTVADCPHAWGNSTVGSTGCPDQDGDGAPDRDQATIPGIGEPSSVRRRHDGRHTAPPQATHHLDGAEASVGEQPAHPRTSIAGEVDELQRRSARSGSSWHGQHRDGVQTVALDGAGRSEAHPCFHS